MAEGFSQTHVVRRTALVTAGCAPHQALRRAGADIQAHSGPRQPSSFMQPTSYPLAIDVKPQE